MKAEPRAVPLRKDIWRPLLVEASAADILARGGMAGLSWRWLPEEGPLRFLADPFGLWRDGLLHVFVERFDYRDRRGTIDLLVLDGALTLLERRPVLVRPWHLSFPQVFEAEGETWMLPEAHRSGRLELYRAVPFPTHWEPAGVIALAEGAVDATLLRWRERWWLFYSPAARAFRLGALHAAYAERLDGPWTPHPANPIRLGRDGSRPGGTPIATSAGIVLPVQDCSITYGGAIRPLRLDVLEPGRFAATLGPALSAPDGIAPFTAGLHTFSAAGPVTLLDVKRTELSVRSLSVELGRHLRQAAGRQRRLVSPRP